MSNGKPRPKPDAMAKDLRATLAQRRPRWWRPALVTAAVALLLMSVPTYWIFYPRPPRTSLHVLALDAVFTPDETVRAHAQLLAPPAEQATRSVRGETIVFVEQRLPGAKPRESVTSSDARGTANVEWPVTPPVGVFLARYINVTEKQGTTDIGRLYVWPPETPLLIVDADETLIAETLDDKAAEALTKAHGDGWRIVYLALAGTDGHDFRKARDWIASQPKLPKGPVLGRRHFPNAEPAVQARQEALKSLQDRFKGPQVVVVKTGEADVRTIRLEGATTWSDVPMQLK